MELTVEFGFSAAHHLPEAAGRCRNTHGHDYRLFVALEGDVRASDGMVIDFHEVDDIVEGAVLRKLEGADLNQLMDCPTAERIAEWVLSQLEPVLPGVVAITLFETPRYSVTLRKPS